MTPSPHSAPTRLLDATGVLVAGGRAVRMGGAPKGFLRLDGEPIAARTLRLFRATFADVLVVANDPAPWEPLGVRVVPDAIAGKGAPGGLHAALLHARTEWIFAAGSDMPFLSAGVIAWLAGRRGDAPALVPRWQGRLEPLHAFWSRRCLPDVERLLRAGDPSFGELAAAVGARVVEEAEWRAIDPDGRAFENVNTPAEAARLGLLPGGPPSAGDDAP
ncbi:MAG TPA: molybdenum cofactor guanylyltransferase [Anaeromyxobacteraceae bacterium]|nr:molybdenum cofactor guanylyltransferase [Anaeromyxobacteraceae bacterium]